LSPVVTRLWPSESIPNPTITDFFLLLPLGTPKR